MRFIQRDAPTAVADVLAVAQFLAGVRVSLQPPPTASIDDGPYVQVRSDGTPHSGRATATENVAVAVFSKWLPEARSLAVHIDSYLQDPDTPLDFSVSPGASLIVAPDDDIGGFVASVTVAVAAPKEDFLQ